MQGGSKTCAYGCLGCGTCQDVCGFNAIDMINGIAVVNKKIVAIFQTRKKLSGGIPKPTNAIDKPNNTFLPLSLIVEIPPDNFFLVCSTI